MSTNEKQTEAIYDAKTLGTGKVLVLGLQHMFAMFGATVLVPAITGLNVSTTLLFGRLYRKHGLRYAMLAHGGCHIVSKLIWLLFI